MPEASYLSPDELESLAAYIHSLGVRPPGPMSGNPAHGAQLYAARGCRSCHIISGEGSGYGPELTQIGVRRGGAYLREALVKPEAAVPPGFLEVEAVTKSGDKLHGIRCNEVSFTIQIKDVAGNFQSLRKADLSELRKLRGSSPMPSYARTLTPAELEDLVAYLASLRGVP
jgi:cytochrome c oxidase cbb3-type subunit 3